MTNSSPTCRAYQEDLLTAISGSTVLTTCSACTNECLIANHPPKPQQAILAASISGN